jgi:16S rRNA G1207 methylase RsmC
MKRVDILDLGCGNGVLGFIATHVLKTNKNTFLYAVDNNENAIKSAKINA